MEQTVSRKKWQSAVIVALALLLLAFLVWLFLRPPEPARQIVFGVLGRRANPSNNVAASPPPTASSPPGTMLSNGLPEITNAGQGSPTGETPSTATAMAPMTNEPPAFPPAASQTPATPGHSPPPPPASSSAPHSPRTWTPDGEYPPQDPAHKNATAKLLAEARAADMARVNPTPARTADLLRNDNERWLNPDAGSNVVFLLDNSMSMTNNGRSVSARREVLRTLQSMNAGQLFYVLFFHSGGYEGMPALAPLPASPENVSAMTNWLFSVGLRTGSDPTKAIQRALGLTPAPDTLWILSASPLPEQAIDNLREANATANAHVNTIALYTHDGEETLRRIADENRGVYRFVPPPNESPP